MYNFWQVAKVTCQNFCIMVYLIHLETKYEHAQHYLGFVDGGEDRLKSRLEYHRKGSGSRFLRAVAKAGINFDVVRTWPDGDRNFERSLKNKKKSSRLCPTCQSAKKKL